MTRKPLTRWERIELRAHAEQATAGGLPTQAVYLWKVLELLDALEETEQRAATTEAQLRKESDARDRAEREYQAYVDGYRVSVEERHLRLDVDAQERGLYPDDQNLRIEWSRGYADARCASLLGHDPKEMLRAGMPAPSVLETSAVVNRLLADKARVERRALAAEAACATMREALAKLSLCIGRETAAQDALCAEADRATATDAGRLEAEVVRTAGEYGRTREAWLADQTDDNYAAWQEACHRFEAAERARRGAR